MAMATRAIAFSRNDRARYFAAASSVARATAGQFEFQFDPGTGGKVGEQVDHPHSPEMRGAVTPNSGPRSRR